MRLDCTEIARTLVCGTSDHVEVLDSCGRLLFANPARREALGLAEGPCPHSHWIDLWRDASHLADAQAALSRALSGEPAHCAGWLPAPDGARFWSTTLTPIRRQDADMQILAVSRDATNDAARITSGAPAAATKVTHLSRRLRSVLEAMSDSVIVYDREWRFQFLNARAQRQIGQGKKLVGTFVWDRFPDLHDSAFGQAFRRAMAEGACQTVTGYYEPLRIWVEARAYPSDDGLTVFFRDITKRKESETALLESEARLRLALQTGGVVAWERNEKTRQMVFSDNAPSVIGFAGCSFEEFRARLHPEDSAFARQELRAGRHARFRFRHADGRTLWISAAAAVSKRNGVRMLHGTLIDVTAQEEAQRRLWHAANHDELTQLPNRSFLQKELQAACKAGAPFALMLLDLDHFKDVNDSEGHDAGDALLRETAHRLRNISCEDTFVARCGGDEFAIVLRRGSLREANALARKIAEMFRAPIAFGERMFDCRVSVGLAIAPHDGRDAASVMKAADVALYAAKADGRDRANRFTPEMRKTHERKAAIARKVRQAIGEGRLIPYYQPKICLRTGRIEGFEALARLRVDGRIETAQAFATALEYPDIAKRVSRTVIEQVLADAARWLDLGLDFGQIAVNLAEPDFTSGDIAAEIAAKLAHYGVSGSRLQIEITESVFLGRAESTIMCALKRLKALGCRVALDDFGTGFASLTHLKRYPVDVIKIDRSFIRDLCEDDHSRAITAAIISLGATLGLRTVAEGIEVPAQIEALRRLGCDKGQGYFFARPMPAARAPHFIRDWTRHNLHCVSRNEPEPSAPAWWEPQPLRAQA